MKALLFILLLVLTVDVTMCQIKIPIKPLVGVLIIKMEPTKFKTGNNMSTITTELPLEPSDINISSNYTTVISTTGPYEQTTFSENQNFTFVPFLEQSNFEQPIHTIESSRDDIDGPILRGAPFPIKNNNPGIEPISDISPGVDSIFISNEEQHRMDIPAEYLRLAPIQSDSNAGSESVSSYIANAKNISIFDNHRNHPLYTLTTTKAPKRQIRHPELSKNNTVSVRTSRAKSSNISTKPTKGHTKITQMNVADKLESVKNENQPASNGKESKTFSSTKL